MSGTYGPTFRYRFGETSPTRLPILQSALGQVDIGDCGYLDTANTQGGLPTGRSAFNYTWAAAVAAPVAPTVANSGVAQGSALTNALTGVKVSYQFPWGEGALSAAGTATPTAAAAIKLTGQAIPAPAYALNVYVETAAGSGVYKLYAQYAATPAWGGPGSPGKSEQGVGDQYILGYGVGQIPAAGNPGAAAVTSGALDVTQFNFCQNFVGVAGQEFNGTQLSPLPYGVKDGLLRWDTGGVFDFACASATFNVGDYVGLAKATGNTLDPQVVIAVSHRCLAVGKVQRPLNPAGTTVRVQIFAPSAYPV